MEIVERLRNSTDQSGPGGGAERGEGGALLTGEDFTDAPKGLDPPTPTTHCLSVGTWASRWGHPAWPAGPRGPAGGRASVKTPAPRVSGSRRTMVVQRQIRTLRSTRHPVTRPTNFLFDRPPLDLFLVRLTLCPSVRLTDSDSGEILCETQSHMAACVKIALFEASRS